MADAALHALVIVSFLLVGVPSNGAVLWIHTRKNSRVARNRFPLIFAAIDLFALATALPIHQFTFETVMDKHSFESIYFDASFVFAVNGYLMTLFMATIDKFYAVMFPFKHGKRRETIFKTAIAVTTIPNAMLTITMVTSFRIWGRQAFMLTLILAFFNAFFSLMFVTINILYIFIIAKLIRNRRNLRTVNNSNG